MSNIYLGCHWRQHTNNSEMLFLAQSVYLWESHYYCSITYNNYLMKMERKIRYNCICLFQAKKQVGDVAKTKQKKGNVYSHCCSTCYGTAPVTNTPYCIKQSLFKSTGCVFPSWVACKLMCKLFPVFKASSQK